MKIRNILIGIGLAVLLTGCMGQLVPHEANQKAALASAAQIETAHETEVTKQVNGTPAPISVTQSGSSNSVSVVVMPPGGNTTVHDKAGSTSHTDQQSTASDSTTIPLFVKLIGLALGLGLLFFIIRWIITYMKANSLAVDAAYKEADQYVANIIGHIEAKSRAAADPATQASMNDLLATAQKERGKLNSA